MRLQPGDHICSVYESDEQLVSTAAAFLADGLTRNEHCWYVPSADETGAIRAAMEHRGVDVAAQSRRSALHLFDSNDTYIRGGFDPEQTMRVFSEAIEQALTDGFNGLRAAADMSWALTVGGTCRQNDLYDPTVAELSDVDSSSPTPRRRQTQRNDEQARNAHEPRAVPMNRTPR